MRAKKILPEVIKMAKGENIFHRKDGRWEARYIKGYELSGKIKYGFCYGKTYREAKEKVTKYKAALVNERPIPPIRQSIDLLITATNGFA